MNRNGLLKMKMLLISNMYPSKKYPSYGTFVKNFIEICNDRNIDVETVVLTKNSNFISKIINYVKYYFKIFFFVLTKKYDIVYVHYAGQNSLPFLFLTKLKQFNLVFNLHGSDVFPEKAIHKFFLKITNQVLKKCRKIVVPSDYYKECVSGIFKVEKEKIYIFPSSGINEKVFHPKSKIKCRESVNINLSPAMKVVGYIGRIDNGKGWDVILNSIFKLKHKGIINAGNYKFVFIGDGRQNKQFDKMVKELSISEFVIKLPAVAQEQLGTYYNTFDVFCFPTLRKSESLGLVGLEALACGIPVIASNYAAPKYYIRDGHNGYKFDFGSSDDLSEKLQMFFNLSDEKVNEIKNNCVRSVIKYKKKYIKKMLMEILLN